MDAGIFFGAESMLSNSRLLVLMVLPPAVTTTIVITCHRGHAQSCSEDWHHRHLGTRLRCSLIAATSSAASRHNQNHATYKEVVTVVVKY